MIPLLIVFAAFVIGLTARWLLNSSRYRWVTSHVLHSLGKRPPRPGDSVHLLLCIADHFEPGWRSADAPTARARCLHWLKEYPKHLGEFRDADGRPPQHTFFFPLEEYDSECVETLARLCRLGFGEVEVHLHHAHDTAAALRPRLNAYKELLVDRHGLLSIHRKTGEIAYGFIHGNWALDNALSDATLCGINNELDLLRETGCYADFTLPAYPSPAQTRKTNSIYYAIDNPRRPRSHDSGIDVEAGRCAPANGLMLIHGPLVFDWSRRKAGILPRIENGCIQENQPPTAARISQWLKAHVHVKGRPDWCFVKLHTHGAQEGNSRTLLGQPTIHFHEELARLSRENPNFHFHYVTAREMYNLARAAEAGWKGSVEDARDFVLIPARNRSMPTAPNIHNLQSNPHPMDCQPQVAETR